MGNPDKKTEVFVRINGHEFVDPVLKLDVDVLTMQGGALMGHEPVIIDYKKQKKRVVTPESGIARNVDIRFRVLEVEMEITDKIRAWAEKTGQQIFECDIVLLHVVEQMRRLDERNDELYEEIDRVNASAMRKASEHFQSQLREKDNKIGRQGKKIGKLQDKCDQLEKEKGGLKARCAVLEIEKRELMESSQAVEAQEQQWIGGADESRKSTESFQGVHTALMEQIRSLEEQNEALSDRNSDLVSENERQKCTIKKYEDAEEKKQDPKQMRLEQAIAAEEQARYWMELHRGYMDLAEQKFNEKRKLCLSVKNWSRPRSNEEGQWINEYRAAESEYRDTRCRFEQAEENHKKAVKALEVVRRL